MDGWLLPGTKDHERQAVDRSPLGRASGGLKPQVSVWTRTPVKRLLGALRLLGRWTSGV